MNLGQAIAKAREKKSLTLRQLEKETGISNSYLCQIESGRNTEPSWTKVVRIARALNLSLEKLGECVPR